MRWSSLRVATKACFSEAVSKRIDIHVTRHHHRSSRGSAWVTLDGAEICRACDWIFTRGRYFRGAERIGQTGGSPGEMGWGEFSAFDFKLACWKLVHEGPEACFRDEGSLERVLALFCHKIGRKRILAVLDAPESTNLERVFAAIRSTCEGWVVQPGTGDASTGSMG